MLVVLSGLPGTGKTTIARALAAATGATYLRIDTIEVALHRSGEVPDLVQAGYRVAYALAEDNLRLGRTVIADSVNPLEVTRRAWRDVAARAGVPALDVHVLCSDADEHRRRVETRTTDLEAFTPPTWAEVEAREWHPWTTGHVAVDTATEDTASAVARLAKLMAEA